ncbi:MAG: glycosyltransferase family 1 protein [Ideonella sp.]|nr:glycosyltransferase family 1 protein [Ideonella sp.]
MLTWNLLSRRPPRRLGIPHAARHFGAPAARVVILERDPNPSSATILAPWLRREGRPFEFSHTTSPLFAPGDYVVIVRYLTPGWRKAIEAQRDHLAGVAYFMDDDLWDRAAWEGLPADYQRRLHDRALRHRPWVERHCDALWVSTEALARKYAQHAPQLIPLMPDAALLAQAEPVHVAYHGTASHGAEIEWLRSVMAEVLARCPQVHFELFGDWRVAHAWRELPRVAVLHPMKWPAYLAYTGAARRHIGLSPLLPTPFNAARGAVKFYDFARMGATGIYSDVAPFAGFVRDGIDGLLLPNEPARWVNAIVALAGDTTRREALAEAARARALANSAGS